MAKIIDITDKLEFCENPRLRIGTIEVEVQADAETVLRLFGVLSSGMNAANINRALELLFTPEDLKRICGASMHGKKLSSKAFMTIIHSAIELIMGDDEKGEEETHTTI